MENVIPIEDLPAFIDATIAKVSEGVALARRRGILAELPKEVQFDVTVIQTWQSPTLVIVATDISNGSDTGTSTSTSTQKGTSKRVSEESGTSTGTKKGSSKRVSEESNKSDRNSSDQSTSAGQNNSYTYTE